MVISLLRCDKRRFPKERGALANVACRKDPLRGCVNQRRSIHPLLDEKAFRRNHFEWIFCIHAISRFAKYTDRRRISLERPIGKASTRKIGCMMILLL
jgi:hypothetical protein